MTDGTDSPRRWVAVFDLDGTLTWRDTLLPFLLSCLRRHPRRLIRLWRLPFALFTYLAQHRDRGMLKSSFIRIFIGGATREQIDHCAEQFTAQARMRRRLRPAAIAALEAHRTAGDHLILLSASPDLYVPHIGKSLCFERIICTEVEWRNGRLDGGLKTPNRRGAEKLRCVASLRSLYPGLPVAAYGNSASDVEHLRAVDRAVLVNGNARARALAARSGIRTANWT